MHQIMVNRLVRDLWWKQTFYEESVKIPLIMSWKDKLP